MLDKTYINENCGMSIKHPSDWKVEEKTSDNPTSTINYIVELQPNNDEGFNNVVGIELNDISQYLDKTLESIKMSEENNITMGGNGTIEISETTSVAGHNAQKIVYTTLGINNDKFKKMEVDILAYNREYKITYDTTSPEHYQKYFSTVEKMISTFKISEPTFEEITC